MLVSESFAKDFLIYNPKSHENKNYIKKEDESARTDNMFDPVFPISITLLARSFPISV